MKKRIRKVKYSAEQIVMIQKDFDRALARIIADLNKPRRKNKKTKTRKKRRATRSAKVRI